MYDVGMTAAKGCQLAPTERKGQQGGEQVRMCVETSIIYPDNNYNHDCTGTPFLARSTRNKQIGYSARLP